MKDSLYSTKDKPSHVKELDFRKKAYDVKREWGEKIERGQVEEYVALQRPFFQKLLIISSIFFGVALLVSAGLFLMGSNSISTDNVIITASGPVRIEAGKEASFDIGVTNKNNVSLHSAVLSVRFPDNTRKPEDLNEELLRIEEEVGVIAEGGKINKRIAGIFFGEEGATKEIVISIEYEVEGSTAVFQVKKLYTVTISSSPVSLEVDSQKEISSGSEVDFEIKVSSNSNVSIKDLILVADYPFGFVFAEATPKPKFNNNRWLIGNLDPGEEKIFKLKGALSGQDTEERIFRFTAGIQDPRNEESIKTPVFSFSHSISIARPALALKLFVGDSQSKEVALDINETAVIKAVWQNNSASKIVDASIVATLEGEILNKKEVQVSDGGFYKSSDNTITWSSARLSSLKDIDPGESGAVSFSFVVLPFSDSLSYPANPNIKSAVRIEGSAPSETGRESKTSSSAETRVKINSEMKLLSNVFREDGPFENSGPIPPIVEESTSYTIVWELKNTLNDLNDSRVVATLPPYVEWLGNVSPQNEKLQFISSDRLVVWDVGTVERGSGFGEASPKVFFKVSLTPSENQVNQSPEVVGSAQAVGKDSYTGITLNAKASALNTSFRSDSSFEIGDDKVRPKS